MLCVCKNRFVHVLSFLWNYSIFFQGITVQQVTALSVCEYGTEHTLSRTNFSVVKFLIFLHRLILSASGKFSSLEICLWYNGPQEEQRPFISGQQQEIWPLYPTSCLLSNIYVRQQRSKLVSAHFTGLFVDLFWKKHMNIMSFSLSTLSQRLKRHFSPTSGFWWPRKAFSTNLKPCNVTRCSIWFVSPVLFLFYSISSTLLLLILNQRYAIYKNYFMNLDTLIK